MTSPPGKLCVRLVNASVLALALSVGSLCGCGATDDAESEGSEGIEPVEEIVGSNELAGSVERQCQGHVTVENNPSLKFTLLGRATARFPNSARSAASFKITRCLIAWAANKDTTNDTCAGVKVSYNDDYNINHAQPVQKGVTPKRCTPKDSKAYMGYSGGPRCDAARSGFRTGYTICGE
jgi:hypothetical protein